MSDLAEPYDQKRDWERIDRPQVRQEARWFKAEAELRAIRYETILGRDGLIGLIQELEREDAR